MVQEDEQSFPAGGWGLCFHLPAYHSPLVRLLIETYSKITLVIIWALSGKKTQQINKVSADKKKI